LAALVKGQNFKKSPKIEFLADLKTVNGFEIKITDYTGKVIKEHVTVDF